MERSAQILGKFGVIGYQVLFVVLVEGKGEKEGYIWVSGLRICVIGGASFQDQKTNYFVNRL